MATVTLCDYPRCKEKATWKVELHSLKQGPWDFTATLSIDVYGATPRRDEMDVCDYHLKQVSFDKDRIAEFEAELKAG